MVNLLAETLGQIIPRQSDIEQQISLNCDALAKPQKSLGQLEKLVALYGAMRHILNISVPRKALVAFSGDRAPAESTRIAQLLAINAGADLKVIENNDLQGGIEFSRKLALEGYEIFALADFGGDWGNCFSHIWVLAGIILGAAASQIPVVLDGKATEAAARLAAQIEPLSLQYILPSQVNSQIGFEGILDLGFTSEVGAGSAIGLMILDSAIRLYQEMATLAETLEEAGLCQ